MLKKIIAAALGLFVAVAFAASVDANKATQAELEALKGVGPGIATKIIDERKKGAFKDWNDLVERVKGVGDGNAAKLSADGMTVNGAAFKPTAATAPSAKKEAAKAKKDEAKAEAAVKKDAMKADAKAKPVVAAATPATPASAATPAMPAKKAEAAKPAASATKAAAADEAKKATAATQTVKAAAPKASEPAKK